MSEEVRKPRKIAILGTAEPHWRAAPYADESWEIWTCGGIFASVPRTDRHFEIHAKPETCKGWGQSVEQEAAARNVYWDWLNQRGPTAVLRAPHPDCPDASVYPIDTVLEAFPDRYFTNTVSYMIALALLEGCDELGLWGIDMALSGTGIADEYGVQRPSVEFYLGIAVGRGIRVHLPPETTLLKCRKLYGFAGPVDDGFNQAATAKVMELTERLAQAHEEKLRKRHEWSEAEKLEQGFKMALEVAGYFQRNMEH